MVLSSIVAACTSSQTVPPPAPVATADRSSDDDDDDDDDDEDPGEEEPEVTFGPAFNYGGVDIGDDAELKDSVRSCVTAGTFFDRFAKDGEGECTTLKLAQVDCTVEGIKAVLSASAKPEFDSAVAGKFAAYKMDQCLDCAPGNSISQCAKNGASRTGTKILWVQDDGESLNGLSMFYSVRPTGAPSSSSSGDGDSESDSGNDE